MTNPFLKTQVDANGIPTFTPQQPKTFQEFMADPNNIQSVAGFVAPPLNINPPKAKGFWDAGANFYAPQNASALSQLSGKTPAFGSPERRQQIASGVYGSQPQQPTADPAMGAIGYASSQKSSGPLQIPAMGVPSAKTQADQAQLATLQKNGAGLNEIKNPFLHVLARIGDVAGTILSPGTMMAIPGTTLHNRMLQRQQAGIVAQDQNNDQIAQNAYNQGLNNQATQAEIALRNAQTAQIPLKTQQDFAAHGLMRVINPDGTMGVKVDPNSPITQRQQAQNNYFDARKQYEQAMAALADAKTKNQPQLLQLAEQRAQTAAQNAKTTAQRLGLSGEEFAFNQDRFYNPQPTSQERKTGDLAQSAVNQVQTMRKILNAHPEFFGPAAGRGTKFQQWLGSQSPDAQQYLSASRYLADHSAGVFGSRSVEVTKLLEQLTDPKTNPAALNAALDQAESTAQHFVDAGKVHGKPTGALGYTIPPKSTVGNGVVTMQAPNGQTKQVSREQVKHYQQRGAKVIQ